MPELLTEKEYCQLALDCISGVCNTNGFVISWGTILNRKRNFDGGASINKHPATLLILNQLCQLATVYWSDKFSEAYQYCKNVVAKEDRQAAA